MTADVPGPPHHTVMIDKFHEQYLRIKDQLPTVYPAPEALVRMASVQANAKSGIFLAKQKNAAERWEWKKKGRQLHAATCRCATSIRKHSLVKNMHTLGMGGLKPSRTLAEFIQLSVHGEVAPDRNLFTGKKQCISQRTQG